MQEKTPQAVQSCHDLILWMLPQLDKFPRVRRFSRSQVALHCRFFLVPTVSEPQFT